MASNINPSLTPVNSLTNFKFWCQKVLPLVYDDSLSYYEVLGKMVVQLNDVIDNVNADTENVLTLKDAFLELQTYVNNFFDDIDQLASYAERAEAAQTAANTSAVNAATSASNASASSLAAMDARDTAVAARQAAQASANNASTAATNANTKANEAAQSAITAQTAQASASQSATLAATDRSAAQTAASTATTKANEANTSATNAETSAENASKSESNVEELVNNIRENLDNIQQNTQDISDLKESTNELKTAVTQMLTVSYSDNRLDPNSQIDADINTSTGVVVPSDYYSVSGKMPCQYGESLYVVAKNGLTNQQGAAIRMAFYTSGNSFIEIQQNVSPFVVPQNAAYCLLRTNQNQIANEYVGVFPYSGTTMSAWIPYSVTKTLSDDYAPLELSNEVASNTAKTAVISAACGENLISGLTFTQSGDNNLLSNRFPVKGNMTYTLTYSGAVDNATAGYVRVYKNGTTTPDVTNFTFKQGYVVFTTQADATEAELYFYNNSGMNPSTFTLSNPFLVYGLINGGSTKAYTYVPYKETLDAETMPLLPNSIYCRPSNVIMSVAHMGQSYYYPQNTIWSWLGAKKDGFDVIECDLQVTADNKIVLIHDPDMRRYGGTAQQTVASLTLEQLRQFDAGAWFNEAYRGTEFPLFEEIVSFAKAIGLKLALDCKTINTAERIEAVATILEKWGMIDEVYWITGQFATVWNRVPNAKIIWAAGGTLVKGSYAEIQGGWFANAFDNFPADKKVQKTVTIPVDGVETTVTAYVLADGVWFCVGQNWEVENTYGLDDLQLEAQYAKAFGCKYGLYAVDDDDMILRYIQNIPELSNIYSNRTSIQSAICRKYGVGMSNRPQNIGEADFT